MQNDCALTRTPQQDFSAQPQRCGGARAGASLKNAATSRAQRAPTPSVALRAAGIRPGRPALLVALSSSDRHDGMHGRALGAGTDIELAPELLDPGGHARDADAQA